jgi:uncharacterized membrane protein YfcA
LWHTLVLFLVAIVAGVINSIAGGGSLLTFPTLIWLGLPSIVANATNTVGVWVGTAGAIWGFRREVRRADRRLLILVAPSLAGGLGGAILLHLTPTSTFDRLVPWLILFATCLFVAQEPLQRQFGTSAVRHEQSVWMAGAIFFQFLVSLYGGYFGAGMGILMLAALSLLGVSNVHEMNAIKNVLALCINGIATVYFISAGLVWWPEALLVAFGSTLGGVAGAGLSRRMSQIAVRRAVAGIGFAMAASLMIRR